MMDLGSVYSWSDQSSHSASSMASEEEEVTSSATPFGPLQDMSSLLQQLPLKRGLSKHYQWKSRSFTCLANVVCLEDLAKPENPYNKKLKTCRSCDGGGSEDQGRRLMIMSKKSTRTRRSCFLGTRPPMAPRRSAKTSSSSISNQTSMLA